MPGPRSRLRCFWWDWTSFQFPRAWDDRPALLRGAKRVSGWRTGIGGLGLVELALDIVAWSTRGG